MVGVEGFFDGEERREVGGGREGVGLLGVRFGFVVAYSCF